MGRRTPLGGGPCAGGWRHAVAARDASPMVGLLAVANSPRQKRLRQFVLPTPLSPISTTCNRGGVGGREAAQHWACNKRAISGQQGDAGVCRGCC
jgi:hypothetical protein